MKCLAPAVGDEFVALGRVVQAGRKQVFTSGELHARRDGTSKLVATASTMLVPSGVASELDAPTAKVRNPS
jgi:acyl-coenzyme A thioesterase PaaI-like protein